MSNKNETTKADETQVVEEDVVEQEEAAVEDDAVEEGPSEIELLRARATRLGVPFHPTIGVEALKKRIDDKLANDGNSTREEAENPPVLENGSEKTLAQVRKEMREEAFKLVRLRITNLNPVKGDWQGEIFTVGNELIGETKMFVPYGEKTDEGWHVPNIIYKQMKARKFQQIKTRPDKSRPGNMIVEQKLVNEFALEVLEPLTDRELADLKAQQAAAG